MLEERDMITNAEHISYMKLVTAMGQHSRLARLAVVRIEREEMA